MHPRCPTARPPPRPSPQGGGRSKDDIAPPMTQMAGARPAILIVKRFVPGAASVADADAEAAAEPAEPDRRSNRRPLRRRVVDRRPLGAAARRRRGGALVRRGPGLFRTTRLGDLLGGDATAVLLDLPALAVPRADP